MPSSGTDGFHATALQHLLLISNVATALALSCLSNPPPPPNQPPFLSGYKTSPLSPLLSGAKLTHSSEVFGAHWWQACLFETWEWDAALWTMCSGIPHNIQHQSYTEHRWWGPWTVSQMEWFNILGSTLVFFHAKSKMIDDCVVIVMTDFLVNTMDMKLQPANS